LGISGRWYGTSALLSRFGATDGDQTTVASSASGCPTAPTARWAARHQHDRWNALRPVHQWNAITLTDESAIHRRSVASTNLPKTLQFYYFMIPPAPLVSRQHECSSFDD